MQKKDFYLYLGLGIALIIGLLLISGGEKKKILKLEFPLPNEKVTFEAGKKYTLKWKSQNIEKIGIVLYKGEKMVEWIAKGIPASKGEFEYKIFEYQPSGKDYRISIFEFPFHEKGVVVFSGEIEILGPQFISCDQFSIEREWIFLPSDFPGTKKVFFTKGHYSGDLDGLIGADKICQNEAKGLGYEGEWVAMIGDEKRSIEEKIEDDGISKNSIFVFAKPFETIVTGKTCHLLLGKNLDQFLEKFWYNKDWLLEKFGQDLYEDMKSLWLGRLKKEDKKECIFEGGKWSFTVSCQNWLTKEEKIGGEEAPFCYTPQGKRVKANYLKGLASAEVGKGLVPNFPRDCNNPQKLICVQK